MKTIYLLTELDTPNIYHTVFLSKDLAQEKIKNNDNWVILELKLDETI